MKEDYLHFIWSKNRVPFHLMKLTDGRDFSIKSNGIQNYESGPDFFNGEVIIDKVLWSGNIELHVKSSDWYLHKHHFDEAYNNVILHVVFEHDKDVFVNNQLIPTLELKEIIDENHYLEFLKSTNLKSKIICSSLINELDPFFLESMKERTLIDRLNRKVKGLNCLNSDFGQVLYSLLAKSFGTKVNDIPFFELSNQLPLKIIKKENKEFSTTLVLGVSGNIENELVSEQLQKDYQFLKEKYSLRTMTPFVWKKKGLRPSGFPIFRLIQFSKVVSNFDFNTIFTTFNSVEMIDFFYTILNFKHEKDFENYNLSDQMKNLIILNCFIPFIWWFGGVKGDFLLKEKALEILSLLKPEKNSVLSKWNKIGVNNKKAYDSQSLLEIYNEFCNNKKCLNCIVGNQILRK